MRQVQIIVGMVTGGFGRGSQGKCVCVRGCVCVCVSWKLDNALAQVLYILFSYIKHRQIKQIAQIKISKYTLLIQIIKIVT